MSYTTVVVGTDGSHSSFRAVDRAAQVASSEGALLLVVCAYSAVSPRAQASVTRQLSDPTSTQVLGTDAAKEALAAAVQRAESGGASGVTGQLVEGDPGQALLSVAEEHGADLLVVGNRGINTLSGRLLGSVPATVSQKSPCDVLIVHTTAGRGSSDR
ncbi:universal stress protein [Geodermatophilus sp. TF02-6]|uniref:universal stress protein n=1 Tax=Geodermatophilus sp. TF02-6 TaxID=2250575 RepID=UPI000DEB868D|nr:universal stress protein [Geodermatophilus sp. TF02-6]RBY82497.1 universal stress protein [Geodermatophilus sp. TF02-6]